MRIELDALIRYIAWYAAISRVHAGSARPLSPSDHVSCAVPFACLPRASTRAPHVLGLASILQTPSALRLHSLARTPRGSEFSWPRLDEPVSPLARLSPTALLALRRTTLSHRLSFFLRYIQIYRHVCVRRYTYIGVYVYIPYIYNSVAVASSPAPVEATVSPVGFSVSLRK